MKSLMLPFYWTQCRYNLAVCTEVGLWLHLLLLCCPDDDCDNISLMLSSLKCSGTVSSDHFMEVCATVL